MKTSAVFAFSLDITPYIYFSETAKVNYIEKLSIFHVIADLTSLKLQLLNLLL